MQSHLSLVVLHDDLHHILQGDVLAPRGEVFSSRWRSCTVCGLRVDLHYVSPRTKQTVACVDFLVFSPSRLVSPPSRIFSLVLFIGDLGPKDMGFPLELP